MIRTATATAAYAETVQVIASCNAGEQLLSGGGGWSGALQGVANIKASYPVQVGGAASWLVQGVHYQTGNRVLTAYALCLQ